MTAELPLLLEEMAEVLDERKTPSSEPLDESRPDSQEEPTHKGNESTDELLDRSMNHAEMVERLGVETSTLGKAKKRID